ncbi:TPA: hypothetical protein ACH3X1_007057 [Trebouxia sp. C0004]
MPAALSNAKQAQSVNPPHSSEVLAAKLEEELACFREQLQQRVQLLFWQGCRQALRRPAARVIMRQKPASRAATPNLMLVNETIKALEERISQEQAT